MLKKCYNKLAQCERGSRIHAQFPDLNWGKKRAGLNTPLFHFVISLSLAFRLAPFCCTPLHTSTVRTLFFGQPHSMFPFVVGRSSRTTSYNPNCLCCSSSHAPTLPYRIFFECRCFSLFLRSFLGNVAPVYWFSVNVVLRSVVVDPALLRFVVCFDCVYAFDFIFDTQFMTPPIKIVTLSIVVITVMPPVILITTVPSLYLTMLCAYCL